MTTYPAESYTTDECRDILDACRNTWTGKRNKALIVVMWRAGLRLAEALALKRRDIDFTNRTIRVLHGKGNKARTVGTDSQALGAVNDWLRIRGFGEEEPVFCTREGKPLKQDYVRAMLPRVARKAGVSKRVHAHGFRHTFAVELAREKVPMTHIQRLLGHTSLATTSIYLASLSPEEALDAVRGREW